VEREDTSVAPAQATFYLINPYARNSVEMGACLPPQKPVRREEDEEEFFCSENLRRLITSLSSLSHRQSSTLYGVFKDRLEQIELYRLHSLATQNHPFVTTIFASQLRHITTLGYHRGAIVALLFQDDLVCLLFEFNNSGFPQSREALKCWCECDRDIYTLRLTTVSVSDVRCDALCVVRADICQGKENKVVTL
jgi:hypothetical protein